jgi:hypothetical protein
MVDNFITIIIDFIGSIIGGVISSIIFIVAWTWFRKPHLEFIAMDNDPSIDPQNALGFFHIRVNNRGRSTAENCHLSIEYKNYLLEPIVTLNPGKWDNNPNPIVTTTLPIGNENLIPVQIADRSLLHFIGKADIRAKGNETFCFLIKYDREDECYAFNADNFFQPNLRDNDKQLGIGDYMITFRIEGDNTSRSATFLLRNTGNRLENIILDSKSGLF